MEAYVLRCAAPLAAADRLAARARPGRGAAGGGRASRTSGAWMPGDEAYLSVARAWLARGEPERARAVLAPLLAVARRVPVDGHARGRARAWTGARSSSSASRGTAASDAALAAAGSCAARSMACRRLRDDAGQRPAAGLGLAAR